VARVIRKLCRDWLKVDIGDAVVAKCLMPASYALMATHREILARLPSEILIAVDEIVKKLKGMKKYVRNFRRISLVAFKIGSRLRKMLDEVIGPEFAGVISSGCYSLLFLPERIPETVFQFCPAHLLRDFQFCEDHAEAEFEADRKFGEQGMEIVNKLIHEYSGDMKAREGGDVSSDAAQVRQGKLFLPRDRLMADALSCPTPYRSRGR
jgi:hypothetical protein